MPRICLVCCQHGNEVFGKKVYEYFKNRAKEYENVDTFIANPIALSKRKRFIDTDLNRSYKQSSLTGYESQIAPKILKRVQKADVVIDIHTTTAADIHVCSIVTHIDKKIDLILSNVSYENVAIISKDMAGGSLIGNVVSGLSLEFNEIFAKSQEALEVVRNVIENTLKSKKGPYLNKTLFEVEGVIKPDIKLKPAAKNFIYEKSQKFYPVLFGEKNYTTHQGFYARTKKTYPKNYS